jgi:hypothetical protein
MDVTVTTLKTASTLAASNVVSDFALTAERTAATATEASFTWTAATNATSVVIQQSSNGGSSWSTAASGALDSNSTSATVTGLSGAVSYQFRLYVTGGDYAGVSNEVESPALSSDTSLSSVASQTDATPGAQTGGTLLTPSIGK